MKPTVSIVIPVRDEEQNVRRVMEETIRVARAACSRFEILVNDDASVDTSPQILANLQKKYRTIRVFRQKKSIGIAKGLEFLYTKARYDYVFNTAGDGEYSSVDLPAMLRKAIAGYDIVVGKRTQKNYTLWRKCVSSLYNVLSYVLFGVKTYDAGSLRVCRRRVLRSIRPISTGVFNEAERIIRAQMTGCRICSVDVHHFPRVGGIAQGARFPLILEAIKEMFRLWFFLKIKQVSPITMV